MGKHTSTTLVNRTQSVFVVRSESSPGAHNLLATLTPGNSYELVRGSNDTYLLHWVAVGDSLVVSFSSDELADNEKITIVWDGTENMYRKEAVKRCSSSSSRNRSNEQRPQQPGSASGTPDTGRPLSGTRKFFSEIFSFTRRSPGAATLRSTNSEPVLDSDVSLTPMSSRHSNS